MSNFFSRLHFSCAALLWREGGALPIFIQYLLYGSHVHPGSLKNNVEVCDNPFLISLHPVAKRYCCEIMMKQRNTDSSATNNCSVSGVAHEIVVI